MSSKNNEQRPESQTGAVPRLDFTTSKTRREPLRTIPLPEIPDERGSVTGAISIRAEGEDKAKYADDTPTRSALTT